MSYGNVHPVSYHLGSGPGINTTSPYEGDIELSPSNPFLTLDYGTDRAGFPILSAKSISGATQIEAKYSEEYPAISLPQADGPWPFTVGLANAFRVETFELKETGNVQSFFVQGGQRWQTLRLLTNTTITLSNVGFNSTAPLAGPSEVPVKLATSNSIYNRLYDLGAGSAHVSCIDAGNAPSTWEITPDGALIRGQTTAQSAKGADFSNYTLTFSTKIARGGTGWRVASGQNPFGAYFVLTSNKQSFLNTNRSLIQPSTLISSYGTSLYDQENIISGPIHQYPLKAPIEDDSWYNISTAITPEAYVVSIDGEIIVSVPIAEAIELAANAGYSGTGSAFKGSFGFGPWQDQAAYFKDVVVTSNNGSTLYKNPMTSEDTLGEYSVSPLNTTLCLDGGKRDRLVWAGDFYHTVNVVASSTAQWKYILGTIEFLLQRQLPDAPYRGLVPIAPAMGSVPEFSRATGTFDGLLDYQDLFLAGIGDLYHYSGLTDEIKPYWTQIKTLVEARLAFIDPFSGLVAASPEFGNRPAVSFLGPANGTAVTGIMAYALEMLTPLAHALGDTAAADLYSATSANLTQAINDKLWNPELGVYSLSLTAPSNYSINGIAWAILSGAANSTRAASSIAKVEELKCGIGYRTQSSEACTEDYQLSPNTNGFLLNAIFKAQRDLGLTNLSVARTQLDDFWSAMVTQDQYYSGASWEYIHPDGSPGINRFTSLSHPWGAAPTYVLPEYVLGISATSAGYKTWKFTPLVEGLDLDHARGTVVTPYGDIEAGWKIKGNSVTVTTNIPHGTSASLIVPKGYSARYRGKTYHGGAIPLIGKKQVKVRMTKRN